MDMIHRIRHFIQEIDSGMHFAYAQLWAKTHQVMINFLLLMDSFIDEGFSLLIVSMLIQN